VDLLSKTRILIVDDEYGITATLSDILEVYGYNVEIANDGYKAIEIVKESFFDIIFMDIKMPGINGTETFKEIKKISPKTVVMMMTAFAVDALISEALKEGAYGVIYKPLDFDKVLGFLEKFEKGGLILMVDDDPNTCISLLDILEEKGYLVSKATSGIDAIERLKEKDYEVVFIDFKMPVMNGLETYLELKKIKQDVKVIMMTGFRNEVADLIENARKYDVYSILYKPIEVDDMLNLIEGIMEK